MPRILVLANHAAGRGRSRTRLDQLRALCAAEPDTEIVLTASPQETSTRAREAAHTGTERVVVGGGDGTIYHAANSLAGTPTALGIVPIGSGNDLARHLHLPLDVAAAARLAFDGPVRKIDLGRVQPAGAVAPSLFASVASFGLDALANSIANRQHRLTGTPLYIYALLRALFEYRVPEVRMTTEKASFEGSLMVGAVANSASYGGGMRVAPDADIHDGLLDVCVVRGMSRLRLVRLFPSVFAGNHLRYPEVGIVRASRIRVEPDRELPIFADGEFIGHTPADFTACPSALSIAST